MSLVWVIMTNRSEDGSDVLCGVFNSEARALEAQRQIPEQTIIMRVFVNKLLE